MWKFNVALAERKMQWKAVFCHLHGILSSKILLQFLDAIVLIGVAISSKVYISKLYMCLSDLTYRSYNSIIIVLLPVYLNLLGSGGTSSHPQCGHYSIAIPFPFGNDKYILKWAFQIAQFFPFLISSFHSPISIFETSGLILSKEKIKWWKNFLIFL